MTPTHKTSHSMGRVAVVGGINLDLSMHASSAPGAGETVLARSSATGLGGKAANQAVAAARTGVAVSLFGIVGGDTQGQELRTKLVSAGVDTAGLGSADDEPSGMALVLVTDDGENRIVVAPGANAAMDAAYIASVAPAIAAADVLIVQGEVPTEATAAAIEIAIAAGRRVVVNLAPIVDLGEALSLADPLIVNEIEASQLTGVAASTVDDVIRHADVYGSLAKSVVVTIGSAGAVLIVGTTALHVAAPRVPVVRDTTGAGDALVGVLAAALASGIDLQAATRLAVASASATVGTEGAAENYPSFSLEAAPPTDETPSRGASMNATPRRPTRTDVARRAGTSVAVVSYVANNGPRNVSPERRQRVLDAMRELGYQPNAIARSLSSTRTNTIGMIVPNISNSFFSELALAVEDAALEAGRLLFIGNSNEERVREQAYVDSFVQQRVDGVLIVGVSREAPLQTIVAAGIPLVILDRDVVDADAARVHIDHYRAAFEATTHLIEHGHSRIACLTGTADQDVADERLRGWADALLSASIDPEEQTVVRSEFSLEGGIAGYEAMLQTNPSTAERPTALFVATDEQARGVLSAIGASGMTVPGDLAIVSVDGTRGAEFSNPSLTSMRQPYTALARAAVDAALDPEAGSTTLRATLHLGRSCGCP